MILFAVWKSHADIKSATISTGYISIVGHSPTSPLCIGNILTVILVIIVSFSRSSLIFKGRGDIALSSECHHSFPVFAYTSPKARKDPVWTDCCCRA